MGRRARPGRQTRAATDTDTPLVQLRPDVDDVVFHLYVLSDAGPVTELSLEMQLAVFAVIAVVSAVALRPLLHRLQKRTGEGNLNARGDSLIGKTIVLDAPILAGRGRVKLGDGSWTVVGPDMVAGARVRVAAVDGTELRVEPAP